MKDNKTVSVPKHYMKQTERIYEVCTYNTRDDRRFLYCGNKDVGCQYDAKRADITCAYGNTTVLKRRDVYYSGLPKQVYAYHGTRSVTDVGVGSVKALPRKRVRRIYLPETDDRGIGSEDLSAFVARRTRPIPRSGYYDYKKTSSKCVGGIIECNTGCVLNEKLSPIVQTRSEATSPSKHKIIAEMAINTIGMDVVTVTTQVENDIIDAKQDRAKHIENTDTLNPKLAGNDYQEPKCSKDKESIALQNSKITSIKPNQIDKGVSSDSLVQHVHNLENPSDFKQSRTSVDPMENKLEKEYRKIFATKPKDKNPNDKPIPDMKTGSMLRRRFEALRRVIVKNEDSTKNAVIDKQVSSQVNPPIRKDVSIASDPPSLEGRSYSNTKIYSPFHIKAGPEKSICKPSTSRKKSSEKRDNDNLYWSQIGDEDSDCQGVKGMFKLWGKKFNLEDDTYKKGSTPMSSYQKVNTFNKQPEKKAELKLEKTVKKDGKKFFFFKKKSKEKPKPYKSKKSVTAGRCEVGEGLMIKIDGNALTINEPKKKIEISDEILRQQWLNKYLTNTIESKNSVQIRWNNNIYATSSSTVFELMDTVYQGTGIVFTSKSEITTGESSFYKSRTQHVNFAHQEIEAWMVPKTVVDLPKQKRIRMKRVMSKDHTDVRMLAQRWFIDKAKAFSRKFEVVLHTKNVLNAAKESSSEYLRIDIPKGFFMDSSSDENRKPSSDEEVFKIVEYETESDLKRYNKDMDTGDHPLDDVKLIVKTRSNLKPNILETVIKRPTPRRDVTIQGSDVNIPKPCDVIGVGIITQKDLREIRKPILKIQDNLTDEESHHDIGQNQKKSELAESYLQEYYRDWTPLGMNLFSWCVSDSQLRCSSPISKGSLHSQGDGSKSCFTIYDDFHAAAVVSSHNLCDPCLAGKATENQEQLETDQEDHSKRNWFKRLKMRKSAISSDAKRSTPKDSLEVFKKRKLYALSDKSKWMSSSYCNMKPSPMSSTEDGHPQDPMTDDSKSAKARLQKRTCRKHVSLKEDGKYEHIPECDGSPGSILMFRGANGCDVCKEAVGICPKHAKVDPVHCEIPDPDCKIDCVSNPSPPCSSNSSSQKIKTGDKKQDLPTAEPQCLSKSKDSTGSCSQVGEPANVTKSQNKCPTILCPHFPPCRKSQSCQKSLDSEQNSPKSSQRVCSDSEKKDNQSPSQTNTKPCKNSKEMAATSSSPKCIPLPCNKSPSPTKSDQFPWPLKCQKSNQSLQDPIIEIPCEKGKCEDDCPSPVKTTNCEEALEKVKSDVNCKPNCPNMPRTSQSEKNAPSKLANSPKAGPIKTCGSAPPTDHCDNKTRLPNIVGKLKSEKTKTCTKECSMLDISEDEAGGFIRLNSRERITIRMKDTTPSTEEIREGMNIKVKDDDGNTIYERIDYRKSCKPCRPSVLGDTYKSSDVNRVSTPLIIKNCQTSQERGKPEEKENKSNASIANVIEIQFKLKITPGDKITELNLEKNKNNDNQTKKSEISPSPQEVFVVKDDEGHISAEPSNKNDVNIRILIKNFKTKSDKKKNVKCNNEFSNKILNKFQTVSTGYSDVYTGQNIDNVFSVHRATIDLTDSIEKPSKSENKIELTDHVSKLTVSSHETRLSRSATKIETDFSVEKSISTEKPNNEENIQDIQSESQDEDVKQVLFTDSEDQDNFDTTTSNNESGIIIEKPMSRQQKKDLLKKVFEKANKTKVKTKDKVHKLRDMLKVILTSDSSDHDEMAVTSNELLKDVTFTSFYKDTDSMNNYNIDSILSIAQENGTKYYPTEEQTSECSKSDDGLATIEAARGCMCSTFADRLNLCNLFNGGCCCRGKNMINEEISCGINIQEDISSTDAIVAELVDVETQNSKYSAEHTASKQSKLNKSNLEILAQSDKSKAEEIATEFLKDCMPPNNDKKGHKPNVLNRNIELNISDEDRIIFLKATPTNVSSEVKKSYEYRTPRIATTPDILQSYATKKAVLEIYAETTVDADGEHTVAKLPKFVYDRESEICRYQEKLCQYNNVCKKNIVMMSIQR